MTFTLTINCDNAAFDEYHPGDELSRILTRIAEQVRNDRGAGVCMDSNGNKVGEWVLS